MKINWINYNGVLLTVFFLYGFSFQSDNLNITYLANCGFMLENQSHKVLIDPFGTKYGDYFYIPSKETNTKIEEGIIPFDSVDLVLITHIHGDHFDPFLTEKFLLKNKQAKMICPRQVYMQIKDSCVNFSLIQNQIISPELVMHDLKNITVNDIDITAIRMQHGTDRSLEGLDYNNYTEYEKTENFGYLIDFDSKTIFHQGDACLKINTVALEKLNRKVDITFLGFFDWDTTSFNLLKNDLHAKSIIFMHGTKPGNEKESEQFKLIEPDLIFLNHELEVIKTN